MSIPVICQCGVRLKAKESLAGRKVKCPKCGCAIAIPDMDPQIEIIDVDAAEAGAASFGQPATYNPIQPGASLIDPTPLGPTMTGAMPTKQPLVALSSFGQPAPTQPMPNQSAPMPQPSYPSQQGYPSQSASIPATQPPAWGQPTSKPAPVDHQPSVVLKLALVGGAFVGLVVLIGVGVYLILGLLQPKDADITAAEAMRTTAADRVQSATPPTVLSSGTPKSPDKITIPATVGSPDQSRIANPQASLSASATPNKAGDVWVVLSNFQTRRQGISKSFSVDFQVVQGKPESGTRYVWILEEAKSHSPIVHYLEFDVNLNNNRGTINGTGSTTFGIGSSGFVSFVAKKSGTRDFDKVSGELKSGQSQSAASPPKSPAQLAGASAAGKAIALARPRIENSIGLEQILVDYQMLALPQGHRIYLVVESTSGRGVEFDISSELRRRQKGEQGVCGGRSIGPLGSRPLKLYVESRGIGFREEGKTISNVVTLR